MGSSILVGGDGPCHPAPLQVTVGPLRSRTHPLKVANILPRSAVLQLTIPTGVWETPLLVDACVARREHVGCPIHARPDTARSFVLAVGEKQCEALYENQSRDSLGLEEKWQVEAVELDPPGPGEVLVKLTASGLCHSDYHLVTGDTPVRFPFVGGH